MQGKLRRRASRSAARQRGRAVRRRLRSRQRAAARRSSGVRRDVVHACNLNRAVAGILADASGWCLSSRSNASRNARRARASFELTASIVQSSACGQVVERQAVHGICRRAVFRNRRASRRAPAGRQRPFRPGRASRPVRPAWLVDAIGQSRTPRESLVSASASGRVCFRRKCSAACRRAMPLSQPHKLPRAGSNVRADRAAARNVSCTMSATSAACGPTRRATHRQTASAKASYSCVPRRGRTSREPAGQLLVVAGH